MGEEIHRLARIQADPERKKERKKESKTILTWKKITPKIVTDNSYSIYKDNKNTFW